jgi:WD40 repeat protein
LTLLSQLGRGIAEAFAWSPDGAQLAVASATGVYLYQADTLEEIQVIGQGLWVTSIAFSRNGQQLALGLRNGGARVWDFPTSAFSRSLEGSNAAVTSMDFSPDGSQLAIGRVDSTLWIWRLTDGQVRHRLRGHSDRVTMVAYGVQPLDATPGGHMLVTASRDGTILAWNSGTGSSLAYFNQHQQPVNAAIFAPLPPGVEAVNEKLATAGEDGTIRFWLPQQNLPILTMQAFAPSGNVLPEAVGIRTIAFTSDGGVLASGDSVGNIALWNAITGEPYRAFQVYRNSPVRQLAFRPGTTFLGSLGDDGIIRIWNGNPAANVDQTEPEPLASLDQFSGAVYALAAQPEGNILASAHGDGAIRLWDLSNGEYLAALRGHNGSVTALAYSPDGSRLVSGGRDGSLRIWDSSSVPEVQNEALSVLLGHRNMVLDVVFSPDGSRVVSSGADGTVRLWEIQAGRQISTLRTGQDWVNSLAFSSDGQYLAAGDERGVLQIWEGISSVSPVQSGEPFQAQEGAILGLAFAREDNLLASSGDDSVINLWEVNTSTQRYTLSGHTQRVTDLIFIHASGLLASSDAGGYLYLWQLPNPVPYFQFQEPWPVAALASGLPLSSEHLLLISGSSDGTLRLWGLNLVP